MFPGLNPKKMQQVMKQMGMGQEEIEASKVIIEKPNGKTIIANPSVVKITMQGQDSFQISGEVEEESSQEDVETVMEKTNCTEKQARETLEQTNDLAETILKLSE